MKEKNKGKTIAVAGNQSTTIDTLNDLERSGYFVEYVINVEPDKQNVIADYQNLDSYVSERPIKLLRPKTYHMKDEETKQAFNDYQIDCVIAVGWQRLFPGWFLDRLSIGAFGMHGSAEQLPKGRGRSPMNWSIIEDRKKFITNLIKYDEGIDSGHIVGSQTFDIHSRDTIRSLQHKNQICQVQLLLEHLPDILQGSVNLTPQPEDVESTYYPKRVPADGVIDWRETVNRIDRLVRAVAKPYPGAFTFSKEEKIYIWEGRPFDRRITFPDAEPGEIVRRFADDTFLVKTAEDTYYITEWENEGNWCPSEKSVFKSKKNPSWKKLAQMKK